jgi:hypothetical protein
MTLGCRLLTLVVIGVLVPAGVKAQSSVTMKGTVSEVVTLSVAPHSAPDVDMDVVSSGSTVRITVSGAGTKSPVIRVPLLVRSNTSFKISALFESQTAVLSQISVNDVRATGRLVSPQIVKDLRVKPVLNPDTSQPVLVLNGPRVSLGGTLNSPSNALQITVLVRLSPTQARDWLIHLTFAATPGSLIQ